MPAYYAHHRFGIQVMKALPEEVKNTILLYKKAYSIGLQGPDLFFFYRPYKENKVTAYGNGMHQKSALPFVENAAEVLKIYGMRSPQFAYILGFICHFSLDSECHGYVEEMVAEKEVGHLEIEEEFEKYLLRLDGRNPMTYPLFPLVPTDVETAKSIAPFYEKADEKLVKASLRWLWFVKRLFYTPTIRKQKILNKILKKAGMYEKYKGLIHQKEDNQKCQETNQELEIRYLQGVDVAVELIQNFLEAVEQKKELTDRFDRTFE